MKNLAKDFKRTSKSSWYNVWLRSKDGISLWVTDKVYYNKVEQYYYHVVTANCRIEYDNGLLPVTMSQNDIRTYGEIEELWRLLQRVKDKSQKRIKV